MQSNSTIQGIQADGAVLAQVSAASSGSGSALAYAGGLMSQLNVFFPVMEGVYLLGIFVTFITLFIVYKLVNEQIHIVLYDRGV